MRETRCSLISASLFTQSGFVLLLVVEYAEDRHAFGISVDHEGDAVLGAIF